MGDFSRCEHDPRVVDTLRQRIAARGRLTFAEVMEVALYHPEGGYYTSHVVLGPQGDFVTAPEEHPAFGALLARQAAQCWAALGHPDPCAVVEMGGGRGTLASAFLAHADKHLPDFAAAVRYRLIDRSPRLLAQQRARLGGDARVTWSAELPAEITGIMLSNELVDAFPVHRVVMRAGMLCERYVVADGDAFAWEDHEPSTPALAAYFARLGLALAEGQQAEVNLAASAWMQSVARVLTRGFVLTIDFGHLAAQLFRPERSDTLLAYRQQRVSDDLLSCLGRQDLIAHVDFSTLTQAGREAGLTALGLVTQRHFLLDLGIEGWLAALDNLPLPPAARVANRRGLLALINPASGELGDAKVLAQARGVTADLDGLCVAARFPNAAALQQIPPPLLEVG